MKNDNKQYAQVVKQFLIELYRSSDGDKLRRPGSETRRGLFARSWKMLETESKMVRFVVYNGNNALSYPSIHNDNRHYHKFLFSKIVIKDWPAPLAWSPLETASICSDIIGSCRMRTGSRPVENGSSTSTKVFVIRSHDGARSGSTPTLLCVVTVQRWTVVWKLTIQNRNVHKWIRLQLLVRRRRETHRERERETKKSHTRENQWKTDRWAGEQDQLLLD